MAGENASSLINRFLPYYRIRQVDRIHVVTDHQKTWEAVRAQSLQQPLFAKMLFSIRVLPESLSHFLHGQKAQIPSKDMTIDEVTRPGSGFQLLGEETGREVVVGSIGQWWKPKIVYELFPSAEFAEFSKPNFGKLAWCFKVDPSPFGGSWISFELRVTATDQEAWMHFQPYWKWIGPFSRAIRKRGLAALERKLGAVEEERIPLPGDDVLPKAVYQSTISKTIESPAHHIWPWLVQMGCRRAGWYSIDILDNGGVPSAKVIHPEFQNISVGDVLPATPQGEQGFTVLDLIPNAYLLLGNLEKEHPFRDTWAFVLEPIGQEATRVMTRVRANYEPKLRNRLKTSWIAPAHQIMQRVQLNNLNRRAKEHFI